MKNLFIYRDITGVSLHHLTEPTVMKVYKDSGNGFEEYCTFNFKEDPGFLGIPSILTLEDYLTNKDALGRDTNHANSIFVKAIFIDSSTVEFEHSHFEQWDHIKDSNGCEIVLTKVLNHYNTKFTYKNTTYKIPLLDKEVLTTYMPNFTPKFPYEVTANQANDAMKEFVNYVNFIGGLY